MDWRDGRREESLERLKPRKQLPCFDCESFVRCDYAMMCNCKLYQKWHRSNGFIDKRRKKGLELVHTK